MLELLEDIDGSNTIRSRTQDFSIRGITPTELRWYESMNSREKILNHLAELQRGEAGDNFSLFKMSIVQNEFIHEQDRTAAEKARVAEGVVKLINKRYDLRVKLILI